MEFYFDTIYTQKALTVMARTIRLTLRKERTKRSRVMSVIVIAFAVLMTFSGTGSGYVFDHRHIVNFVVIVALILALVFEDQLNGYITGRRMLCGTRRAETFFREENYYSMNEIGRTEWEYENIALIAETNDYFVFLFDGNHAQLYDKSTLTGGSVEEFRLFISGKTGKTVQNTE